MNCALVIIALSYLLGSVPFGLLAGKVKGVDVRHHGSGNIGATNVFRILGPAWGVAVFIADAGKGVGAVLLGGWLSQHFPASLTNMDQFGATNIAMPKVSAEIIAAIWCIIGHNFPVWLGFKGGKGVATSAGVLLGLVPAATGIALVVWIAVFFTTRYVSVASICASLSLPLAVALLPAGPDKWPVFGLAVVAAFLVLWRHRTNIERLRLGTEHRFGKPKT